MNHYEFRVLLNAYGDTPEEAWNEAVEGFYKESWFDKEDVTFIEKLDEDGNKYKPRRILLDRRFREIKVKPKQKGGGGKCQRTKKSKNG